MGCGHSGENGEGVSKKLRMDDKIGRLEGWKGKIGRLEGWKGKTEGRLEGAKWTFSEVSEEMREFDRGKKGVEPAPGLVSEQLAPEGHSEPPRKFHAFPRNGKKKNTLHFVVD